MSGTFILGDRLQIEAVPFTSVRAGDVVVFRHPASGVQTVHRVVRRSSGALRTRGDYCDGIDPFPVTQALYTGVVTHYLRAGARHRVHGGWVGLCRGGGLRALRMLSYAIVRTAGRPYVWLRRSELLQRYFPLAIIRLRLVTPRGLVIKYVRNGRTVALWRPVERFWECRKPYDLFLSPPDGARSIPRCAHAAAAWPPELRLVFACAQAPGAGDESLPEQLLGMVEGRLDWPKFYKLARDHRILPLVHDWMSRLPPSAARPPAFIVDDLARCQRTLAVTAMRATAELCALMPLFEREGITAVPIKGPALAALAFGSIHLRQYEDLDFVVPRDEIPRAKELLVNRGYGAHRLPPPRYEAAYLKTLQDWVFHDKGRRHVVDIKPVLLSHLISTPEEVAWLVERLQMTSLEGKPVKAPGKAAMLILCCMHGSANVWARASLLADVAALAGSMTDSEWESALVDADRIGKRVDVLLGLFLAQALLGVKLPERIRTCLDRERRLETLADVVMAKIGSGDTAVTSRESWSFEQRTRTITADVWRCRWRYLFVPSEVEWARFRLPPACAWLLGVARPVRLLLGRWR